MTLSSSILKTTASSAAGGVAAATVLQSAASAAVPTAMSTFGTVVAGVGTLHAPASALGIAAILQTFSAAPTLVPATVLAAGCMAFSTL